MTGDPYLVFPGSLAFSGFRLARLAQKIGAIEVQAIWVHFVDPLKELSDDEMRILGQLLQYGHETEPPGALYQVLIDAVSRGGDARDSHTALFHVYPRPGTISPWSSQATGVAHVCELEKALRRIERGMVIAASFAEPLDPECIPHSDSLHDRMTQVISRHAPDLNGLFGARDAATAASIPFEEFGSPHDAMRHANKTLGLALDSSEMDYLVEAYSGQLKRPPTDVELFMFAQVNSEHCRHKQFNADWTIDGVRKPQSLYAMIQHTHQQHPEHVVSAYSDNAAVLQGENASVWAPGYTTGEWIQAKEQAHILCKVETHNHPPRCPPSPERRPDQAGKSATKGLSAAAQDPRLA